MAIDPTQIDPTDKQHLVDLVEKIGDAALREAVNAYLARQGEVPPPNGLPTAEPADDEVDLVAEYRDLFPGHEPGHQRVSRARVREILSKIPESLSAELIADREDRF